MRINSVRTVIAKPGELLNQFPNLDTRPSSSTPTLPSTSELEESVNNSGVEPSDRTPVIEAEMRRVRFHSGERRFTK